MSSTESKSSCACFRRAWRQRNAQPPPCPPLQSLPCLSFIFLFLFFRRVGWIYRGCLLSFIPGHVQRIVASVDTLLPFFCIEAPAYRHQPKQICPPILPESLLLCMRRMSVVLHRPASPARPGPAEEATVRSAAVVRLSGARFLRSVRCAQLASRCAALRVVPGTHVPGCIDPVVGQPSSRHRQRSGCLHATARSTSSSLFRKSALGEGMSKIEAVLERSSSLFSSALPAFALPVCVW